MFPVCLFLNMFDFLSVPVFASMHVVQYIQYVFHFHLNKVNVFRFMVVAMGDVHVPL